MRKARTPLHVVFLQVFAGFLVALAALVVDYFPSSIDSLHEDAAADRAQIENYYATVYTKPSVEKANTDYVQFAQENLGAITRTFLSEVIHNLKLEDKKALEVGAGSGQLQDLVQDYTGLDIAADAQRYFHKPFVSASATAMPFPDSEFDTVWTFFTLEHIPHPEMALNEMRRVIKPGGVLVLSPAWNCSEFAGRGYRSRPFSDFDFAGKIKKVWAHFASTDYVMSMHRFPIRLIRAAQEAAASGPSRLHFRALKANFGTYWEPDSDAFTSVDMYEAYLWFKSRGDECLNCQSILTSGDHPLLIRVHKPARNARASAQDGGAAEPAGERSAGR